MSKDETVQGTWGMKRTNVAMPYCTSGPIMSSGATNIGIFGVSVSAPAASGLTSNYTMSDIVTQLKSLGLLASDGTPSPAVPKPIEKPVEVQKPLVPEFTEIRRPGRKVMKGGASCP